MVDGAFRIWETQGREVKRKRYATSTDSRGYIPVIEYPLNSHLIMADSETGYVLITAIWRALGRTKADVPGYGTLVLSPTSAASSTRGSPRLLAFSTSKPRRDLKKRDEARAAALKAQNNPKRVTAGQAREGRRLAGTSAGGASATAQHSESSLPFGPYYLPPLPLPPTGPLPRSLSFPSSLPSSASLFASSSTHLLSSLPPPPQPVAPAPPTMPAFPSYAHRAQLPPLRLAPISSILPPAMLYPYPTPCTATLPEGWGWEAKQGMQGGK
ncbi:hypothetical protein JCM10213v2_001334 [Rhodosporidiobolus nylandii]